MKDYEYGEYKQQIVPEDFIQAIEDNGGSKEFVAAIRAQNKRHLKSLDRAWEFERAAYCILGFLLTCTFIVLFYIVYL